MQLQNILLYLSGKKKKKQMTESPANMNDLMKCLWLLLDFPLSPISLIIFIYIWNYISST